MIKIIQFISSTEQKKKYLSNKNEEKINKESNNFLRYKRNLKLSYSTYI